MDQNPPPKYARGRACIVGNVENALVLCTLLESVQQKTLNADSMDDDVFLRQTLQAYSRTRAVWPDGAGHGADQAEVGARLTHDW